MTAEEKLYMLAAMVNEEVDEGNRGKLNACLEMAGQAILNRRYPFGYEDGTEVDSRYGMLQCEMAAYKWNKRGAEGQTSHSENGVSRGYENADYPDSMMAQIVPMGVVH